MNGVTGKGPKQLDEIFTGFIAQGAFDQLPPEVAERFRALARVRILNHGETLYRRGATDRSVYVVTRGTVIVWSPGTDGRERPIHLLRPGFWLASPFTIAGEPRLVTITASGSVEVVFVTGDDFDGLLADEPMLERWVARLAAQNTDLLLNIIKGLLADGALPRLAARLAAMTRGEETIELSQAQLARLTGLSRNTVQRALDALQRRGVVSAGYRRLIILDRSALEEIAAQGVAASA